MAETARRLGSAGSYIGSSIEARAEAGYRRVGASTTLVDGERAEKGRDGAAETREGAAESGREEMVERHGATGGLGRGIARRGPREGRTRTTPAWSSGLRALRLG